MRKTIFYISTVAAILFSIYYFLILNRDLYMHKDLSDKNDSDQIDIHTTTVESYEVTEQDTLPQHTEIPENENTEKIDN